MTSTSHLQTQPESYSSIEECKKFKKNIPSNPRYKNFKQTHFTAGDIDQFEEYRDMTNGQLSIPKINLDSNKFKNTDLSSTINWDKYKNLNATSVDNTFNYMFHNLQFFFRLVKIILLMNGLIKLKLILYMETFINLKNI